MNLWTAICSLPRPACTAPPTPSALESAPHASDRTEAADIEVIEAFTASKASTRPNEDAFFVGRQLAAVIDGATDKSGLPYEWAGETVTSGRFAALVAAAALADLDEAPDPPTAAEAVAHLSERLDRAVLAQRPGLPRHHRPACALIAYSEPHREVWSVGDCAWAADGVEHRAGLAIDDVTSGIRAAIIEAHLEDGWSPERLAEEDPGRVAIQGVLERQGMFANRVHELGYGVVNGTAVPAAYLHVHDVRDARTLTLASDGYPELLATREASDRRLAELLRADPLCIGALRGPKAAPSAEAYDDRTWLSLRL